MKHSSIYSLFALSVALLLSACSEEPSISDPSNGGIVAQSYVALGNSVTAGVQSGALYADGQLHSYPNLIAQQIGAEFVQPLMTGAGTGERVTLASMHPVTLARAALNIRLPDNISHPRPYNNLGIPLAVTADLLDDTPVQQRQNPVFQLILRNQAAYGASVLEQAMNLQPTLITLWIGSNDILAYATSGGTTGTNTTLDLPTDRAVFETQLTAALEYIKLRAPNAKVVLGNIPEIAAIPFFTTATPFIVNGNIVTSLFLEDGQGNVRRGTPSDMVLLTGQTAIEMGFGQSENSPLPDRYVLAPHEQSVIAQAVSDYNAVIGKLSTQYGYALADLHRLYNDILARGYTVAGESFSTAFISGGLFSLDGIHPSSKGSGVLANEFIRAMNAHYNANIRYVDIAALPGIPAPIP